MHPWMHVACILPLDEFVVLSPRDLPPRWLYIITILSSSCYTLLRIVLFKCFLIHAFNHRERANLSWGFYRNHRLNHLSPSANPNLTRMTFFPYLEEPESEPDSDLPLSDDTWPQPDPNLTSQPTPEANPTTNLILTGPYPMLILIPNPNAIPTQSPS
jgi:hypothetical protein